MNFIDTGFELVDLFAEWFEQRFERLAVGGCEVLALVLENPGCQVLELQLEVLPGLVEKLDLLFVLVDALFLLCFDARVVILQ